MKEEAFPSIPVISVSELVRTMKMLLEENFFLVRVAGELSSYKKHSSGHQYFSLKDEKALIRCALFKGSGKDIRFELEDGMEVVLTGRISIYERSGDCQFIVEHVEPVGKGALQIAFEQMLQRLKNEGILDRPKKPIPKFPKAVGIITSPSGAAVRDMIKVIHQRFRGMKLYVFPAQVQGVDAKFSIAHAIEMANRVPYLDVLIVGRGGGSMEDLWCFNELEVAYAIAGSQIPIISAVGHEVDTTVSDLVADLRAATPSHAAEMVTSYLVEIPERVNYLSHRLKRTFSNAIQSIRSRWSVFSEERIFRVATHQLDRFRFVLDEWVRRFDRCLDIGLKPKLDQVNRLHQTLEMVNPKNMLKRGYSLMYKKGESTPIHSIQELAPQDEVQIHLYDGFVEAQILNRFREKDTEPL